MKTRLQEMRKRAGFKSARAYAEYKGLKVGTYTNYEQGLRPLTIDLAWEFADDFGCSLDELAGRAPLPVSEPRYTDSQQERLNACYENMNGEGQRTLVKIATSLERDASNRVEKMGENSDYKNAAIA